MSEIKQSASEGAAARQTRAEKFGLQAADLSILDAAAQKFDADEAALRDSALQYHADLRKTGKPDDPVQVRTFTVRRTQAALAAASRLQSALPAVKYNALENYVRKVGASVTLWK